MGLGVSSHRTHTHSILYTILFFVLHYFNVDSMFGVESFSVVISFPSHTIHNYRHVFNEFIYRIYIFFLLNKKPRKWIPFVLIAILSFIRLRSWECGNIRNLLLLLCICVCVCLQLFKFNGKTAVFAIIWVVNFRLGYKSIKRLTFGPTENCRQYVDLCSCGLFKYLHASNKLQIWLLRRTQFVHYIVC